ncbi:MAG TPA: signal peptidase II [Kiritimatiellia bacterium]|nr:signal peptidase II [Kiritimatiellia bacterium]
MLPLVVAAVIALSDQWTKAVVRAGFALGESRPVIDGFFNLTYVRNTGAAWGIFGGQNTYLTILSIVMLVVMVCFRRSFLGDTWEHRLALGLMIGGIVGNLHDRIRLGWVTDFFDFYIRGWHWPAFNIADAAICTGVGIYIISAFWISKHPLNDRRDEADAKPPAA